MSAWPDQPDDFTRRAEAIGGGPGDFAERRFFGRYLDEILRSGVASGNVEPLRAEAVSATRTDHGWRIALDNRSAIEAKALALAVGNQAPRPIPGFDGAGERYVANPWGQSARSAIERLAADGGTLVIGTGLSMVDLALSLEAAGSNGRIVAVSRRGLVPRAHGEEAGPRSSADLGALPKGNLRALTRWIRRRAGDVGWRAAIDSLRPHSHVLWQALPLDHQRRFLRHARPWWDVHRHRIAPQVGRTIARMIGEGRLEVMAGRICSVGETESGLLVGVRRRGREESEEISADYAINSTGPLHAMSKTEDALLRGLLDAAEIAAEPLDIGIAVDKRSRASGTRRLWALGALAKGRYWEIIAVPDIREQVAAVAEDIAKELGA